MNRTRLLLLGTFALLVAGLVSLKIAGIIKHSLATAAASTDIPVVVAVRDLSVGQQLTDSDVRLTNMPAAALPQGVFHTLAEVTGRGVVLPMLANEVVLSSKVAGPGEGSGLPSMIMPGMRAVSVKVNDVVSVAGFVGPGTHVDVIVTGNPTKDSDAVNTTTTTVLQDVPVLAAGKKLQHDSEGKAQDVPVITLLVTPADAQLLTLASSEGRIQLALRNPTDVSRKTTEPVRNAQIYGLVAPPRPRPSPKVIPVVKAPPPATSVYNVEIIRGDKRDTAKF
jgi:pilus assembly protein CpaB